MGDIAAQMAKERYFLRTSEINRELLDDPDKKEYYKKQNEDLAKIGNDMDPESPVYKQLKQREKRISFLEEELELQSQRKTAEKERLKEASEQCDEIIKEK